MFTRREIQDALRSLNVRPSRLAGQHFLVASNVAAASLAAADLTPGETVLEVGAGLGSLTEPLLQTGARVIAVERTKAMAEYVRRRFLPDQNLTVIAEDIFRVDLRRLFRDNGYVVVANLPYNITSLFLRNALTQTPRPNRMVLLIQREVAYRLVGHQGDRSLLTLLAGFTAETEIIQTVERSAFWPTPEVTSAIVRLRLKPVPAQLEAIMRLGRIAFAGRRKQLQNSLAAGLHLPVGDVRQRLGQIGLKPTVRPQELVPQQWEKMHQVFVDTLSSP